MRILFLTRHEGLGASSRYRSIQYFDALRAQGHVVSQSHFYSDAYLRARYTGKVAYFEILKSFVRRFIAVVWLARGADAIFVEKEAFPFLPATAERLLRLNKAAVIYDFDDAIWHSYNARNFGPFTGALRGKIPKSVANSDHVVAGSRFLEQQVKEWGAPAVSRIPTSIPMSRYQGAGLSAKKTVELVWIGSMSTGPHIQALFPILQNLHCKRNCRVRLIGFPEALLEGETPAFTDVRKWDSSDEIDLLASSRIGLMPLPNSPYERGKCGFKLIQYMGSGLPVIASPVGENRYIVEDGKTGFLADSEDKWALRINQLLDDESLAVKMGERGFDRFKELYSSEMSALRLEKSIRAAVASRR
ncbi:glycosyltransferase family 4 protein [Erythrobacter sp. YT30]|uniref:glycosyltransferase family 4 protein n=1 Tax=Erythrobacter sp. YT30 TaxID=1735012 RepID=UPI00076CA41E|nr:glycosyltransferase family 4 protein [Erythrobacter sp. YT30]KWV91366.1 hypothetical protein AUC45_08835 [Erythrobacter sp. YT30]